MPIIRQQGTGASKTRSSRCSADGRVLSKEEEGAEASRLRKGIVAEMQRNQAVLCLFVAQEWDSYMRRMAQSGTWGGVCFCP